MRDRYQDQLIETARRLAATNRPLLISHAKADGDAIGSLLAMRELLTARGINATAVTFDDLPTRYRQLDPRNNLKRLGRDLRIGDLGRFDSVIILDTCSYSQLEPVAAWLRTSRLPKCVIDHHQTRENLADHYLIEESAAATCLIIYDLAIVCGWSITFPAAEALFVGIATDTGWFRHSNTDARALAASADLVNRGVIPNRIFDTLYQADRLPRIRLLGKAIESLELLEHDRLAVMSLPARAFIEIQATAADTEDIVNEPMRIETVVVSILLVEQEGVIRVNLRSRAPMDQGDADIDVSAVAAALGGGGHRRAAGVRLPGSHDQARAKVLDRLRPLLASVA